MIDRRDFMRTCGLGALVAAWSGIPSTAQGQEKLNVLFILVDDLGWFDLGCYGSTFYETPNLDRLATSGVRFTNAYAACPVCSPTRAAIMTGKHPARLNITDWIPGSDPRDRKLLGPQDEHQLPLEETTLAEVLRAFGFQFPVISCGATYAAKDVLGDVPVEPDGAVYFRVPAGVPIYFMALDSAGRAVQRMRSFTHLMPGETQGCVGCHEPRHGAPSAQPQHAPNRPFRDLDSPEWGRGGFDYARVVQPVLDRYCIECHDSIDPPQGVDLTGGTTDYFNVSYDVLTRENQGPKGSPYVNWIPTYNGQEQNILETRPKAWGSHQSMLADLVWTGHPDPEGSPRFEMDDTSRRRTALRSRQSRLRTPEHSAHHQPAL